MNLDSIPSVDFYVSVIDNYGDMGFAVNLALSLHERHSSLRIRFFSDDRNLFRKFFMGNTPEWMEYMPLSALDQENPPRPSELICSFFDRRIPEGYLSRFPSAKTIIQFGYFLLHPGVGSLHGTEYLLANGHDRVIHFIPSLLPETGGVIVNPEIERRNTELTEISKMETREKFILKCHPELVSGSSTSTIISEIHRKIPDRSPEGQLKNICEKKWISVFVYEETLAKILGRFPPSREGQGGREGQGKEVFFVFGSDVSKIGENSVNMPFLSLEDYGVFQSLCDMNIVRGENSLCQGLLSGKPLLWDIYKEKNEAHVEKIEDFIQFLRPFFPKDAFDGYARIFREFNKGKKDEALSGFLDMTEALQPGFEKVAKYVREEYDLVGKLEEILRI